MEATRLYLRLRATALASLACVVYGSRPVGLAFRMLLLSRLSLITIHDAPLFQKNVLIVSIKA
jgi:hypothetical protein